MGTVSKIGYLVRRIENTELALLDLKEFFVMYDDDILVGNHYVK